MELSFQAASRYLQRLALPPFPQAHDHLVALVRAGNLVEAFKTCFPVKWKDMGCLGLHDLDSELLHELQQSAISALAALFPIQEDYMDMLVQEDEPLQIHPESCGFAWDDEWFNEILQDPSELPPGSALALFFKVLWAATTQIGREYGLEVWERAQAHFGYPCALPQFSESIRARDFDWDVLYDLLEAHELGQFRRAVDVALCDTGNLFLDTNPETYGYGVQETPDFTTHNILELRKIWAEAESWLTDYNTCNELVHADPTIYTRLAAIWEQTCASKASPKFPKTLVEVFSGDHDEPSTHPTLL